jgi:hypothetical protein
VEPETNPTRDGTGSSITLGIDLAVQRSNTALCAIEWAPSRARLRLLAVGSHQGTELHDKFLITAVRGMRLDFGDAPIVKTGIDAPFGWPDTFVDAINAHHSGPGWPSGMDNSLTPYRWRRTDEFVMKHWDSPFRRVPLSVSADKIAMVAMRCAVIQADLRMHHGEEAADRLGRGMVCEVYPAVALRYWTSDHGLSLKSRESYRGKAQEKRRRELIEVIKERLPLEDPDDLLGSSVRHDHALDAFVSALVARALELELAVTPEDSEQVRREGWIHLPTAPLAALVEA